MTIPNRPTLNDLPNMPIGDVAALPAETLALLQDEADEALRSAKTTRDWIGGALALKYDVAAAKARQTAGKDTGTVRIQDGFVTVEADLPKKVVWDQKRLADVGMRLGAEGEDPEEYIDVTYKVQERRYTAWPRHIREHFEPARTVRVGKPTFRLSLNNEVIK